MGSLPCPMRQQGLTLVELMVAMSLGLLLTAGLGYLLVGSLATYRTQDGQAHLQETGRFIMDSLGRDISKAGYVDITPVYTDTKTAFVGEPITGENGVVSQRVAERKAHTDYLRLSFDGTTDCTGNAVAVNPVVNEYYVNRNDELVCAGNGGQGQVLIDGVEDMQLVYGVDSNGDRTVDRYTDAPADWTRVIAVQVSLTLRASANPALRRTLNMTYQLRNRGV